MKHHRRLRSFVQAPHTLLLAFCLLSIPLGLTLFLPPPVYATAMTVNTTSDAIAADGQCSLREAIQAANTNAAVNECPTGVVGLDTITITATGTIVLGSMLPAITDTLAIDGPGASLLTISGSNAVRVMQVDSGVNVDLSNVSIANGNEASYGGGIYNAGKLTLTYTTFYSNTATNSGGGIYNAGTLTITNSTIYSNTTASMGGGIASEGTLNISNSTFYSNTATSIGGGGIGSNGMLNITNSTVHNNSASSIGGGIRNDGAGTITNSTVHANTSPGDSAGGIFNVGTLTVTDSTVSGNISGNGGGIRNDGTLTVTNTTIYSNTATFAYGGILNYGVLTVTNSTLAGNAAPSIGGIAGYGTTTLRNTIIANSLSGGNCDGAITDGGNNLQFNPNSGCGVTITAADPKLGPLANNGGSTQTMALLPGSPAIDGVTFNAPNGCPSTDQRGWQRPFGSYCDIGAYERGAFLYLPLILK